MSVLSTPIPMPRLPKVQRPARPRRAVAVTGLDISATQAIAVQARVQDGRIVTERVAVQPLPPSLLREGVVVDPDGLARELRRLFARRGFARRVRVGLATPRTVLRVIDLPPLDDRDIKLALRMQAQDRIPMPLERAVVDFQKVGLVDTPEGQRLRVVVVVTEREGVERLLQALRRAGLKPVGVDLSIFAVIRALRDHEPPNGPLLYAHLGDLGNIAIAEAGICRFTRVAPPGLATLVERLIEEHELPAERVVELLQQVALDGGAQLEESDELGRVVRELLAHAARELGTELRTAAEFYANQYASPVSAGVVTGPLAQIPGFVDAVASASGLDLACGGVVEASEGALGDVDPRIAALASGLAIGELH